MTSRCSIATKALEKSFSKREENSFFKKEKMKAFDKKKIKAFVTETAFYKKRKRLIKERREHIFMLYLFHSFDFIIICLFHSNE